MKIREYISKIIEKILEMIFPSHTYCIMCGSIIDETRKYGICDNCIDKFLWIDDNICQKCGKPLNAFEHENICQDCKELEHTFDIGYTCCGYGLYERQLVVSFKKKDQSFLKEYIGQIMYERIAVEDVIIDLILPVPIHKSKLKLREYNQAELLAKVIAEKMQVRCYADILLRNKKTNPMKKLSAIERRENIKDAFEISKSGKTWIEGKNILLVDDIYTTGATADVCSTLLKESGANAVYVLTFAAGIKKQNPKNLLEP